MKTKYFLPLFLLLFLFTKSFSYPTITSERMVMANYHFISTLILPVLTGCATEDFDAASCKYTLTKPNGVYNNTAYRISWDFDSTGSDASIINVGVPFILYGPSSGYHILNYTIYFDTPCTDDLSGTCQ